MRNGIPLMAKITAAGCSVTALAAAFIAANRGDVVIAAASALSIFGWVAFDLCGVECNEDSETAAPVDMCIMFVVASITWICWPHCT